VRSKTSIKITNKKELEKLKAVSEHKIPYLDIKQFSGIYCYSG
jgi:hypothetical protein